MPCMSVTVSRSWAHPWPGDASVRVVAGKRRSRCVPFAQDLWQRIGVDGTAHPDSATRIRVTWGRSDTNPVKGWYGLKTGLRGRFGVYIPPLMEALGLAEVTHEAKANRMRAT